MTVSWSEKPIEESNNPTYAVLPEARPMQLSKHDKASLDRFVARSNNYVRFVSADPHPTVDAELGMFAKRNEIDFSEMKGSIQRAQDEAWYWFRPGGGGGLHRPNLRGHLRNQAVRKSLFWFVADAAFWGQEKGSVVRRARQLGEVLTSAGFEIREIQTDHPGEIIWHDYTQVLARPTSAVERAFPNSPSTDG
jgi:hypothetical protein